MLYSERYVTEAKDCTMCPVVSEIKPVKIFIDLKSNAEVGKCL